MLTAFILDPAVAFFQRAADKFFRLKRGGQPFKSCLIGASCAYVLLLAAISLAVFFAVKFLGITDATFAGKITKTQNDLEEAYARIAIKLSAIGLADAFASAITKMAEFIERSLIGLTADIPKLLSKIAATGADIFLGFIIAFYISKDKAKHLRFLEEFMNNIRRFGNGSSRAQKAASSFISACGEVFSLYVRGQLTDAAIMGALFCAALSLIGVPFSLVIGVFGGIANLIPYFGAVLSLCAATLSCLLAGMPYRALIAAVSMCVLQQIDAVIIIPKVIGKKVDVSPLATIVAISVGGSLFGIWGMALAVPAAAVFKRLTQPSG